MRKLLILCMCFCVIFTGCEKGYTDGVEDNEVNYDELVGGWKISSLNCQMVYKQNPLYSFLKKKMEANLSKRMSDGSLYFTRDTIYYIETPTPEPNEVSFVRAQSAYYITNHPATIQVENHNLICDAYAEYFYIKMVDEKPCLYLTRDGALRLIEEDGEFDAFMGTIKRAVDEAQFEFYLERNHLKLYDDLELRLGISNDFQLHS